MEEHRSFVKHSYIRASQSAAGRAKAHVNYVAFRPGKDRDKDSKPREFFSSDQDKVAGEAVKEAIDKQPKYGVLAHKFILSPGVEGADVQQYTKAVMQDLSRRKGVELDWYGIVHENTANPHCHVIVMGKGKDGRTYKITKADHRQLKEEGDRYLRERGLLKEEKLREQRDSKLAERAEKVGRFINALKAGVKEYGRVMEEGRDKDQKDHKQSGKDKKETQRGKEEAVFGTAPSYDQLLAKNVRRERREKAKAEMEWKAYCRPIEVDYQIGTELEGNKQRYDRASRLEELRELEQEYKAGVPWVREQMTARDSERLSEWITEKHRDNKKLERESEKVGLIRVDLGSFAREVTSRSSHEEIEELKQLEEQGKVFLTAAEKLAVERWMDEAKKDAAAKEAEGLEKSEKGSFYDREDQQPGRERKRYKTDKERLQDRLPGAYRQEGYENKKAEREVRSDTEAARKENLKKQLNEQRKIEGQRETVDGAYTEKWGASLSAIAAGPMGAGSGGLRDLGPNEALRLIKIGMSQMKARKLQKAEIAKGGEAQRDLAAEQTKLVDNRKATGKDASKGPGISAEEARDRQEADSFLKEIKERKKKEADRDQSRDPDRFDEWTGR
ncbi:MAG: hypothetical protein Q8T09_00575 [Candidatus Melainabacteria bacterium]|nr:hypothetical protein [Candidatus Melainabacteria bacterium]